MTKVRETGRIWLSFFFLLSFLLCFFLFSSNSRAQWTYYPQCTCDEYDPVGTPCLTYAYICYNEKQDFTYETSGYTRGSWRFTATVYNPCNTETDTKIRYGYTGIGQEMYINDVAVDTVSIPPNSSKNFYKTLTFDAWWACDYYYSYGCVSLLVNKQNQLFWGRGSYEVRTDQVPACPPAAPTATPTPISCPLAIQSMSFSGSGTLLMNDYNTTQYKGSPQYTVFTANKTGKITKAEIYGTLDRDIPKGGKVLQCKITDSEGTTNLGESSTNNGAFTKGVSWMGTQFTTPVNIVNGTSYRLYCKVNNVYGGGLIYWLDNYKNRTDKAYRLYLCE